MFNWLFGGSKIKELENELMLLKKDNESKDAVIRELVNIIKTDKEA